jgi:TP901 family phage tail tape measure protein
MADDSILIQIQLGSPTKANINAVTRQIRSALGNISANVQIQNGRQATQTLQNIKSKTDAATKSTSSFAEAIGLSARRFVAFTSAVAVVGRLTSALSQATREAIKFEREFVKLAQVFDTDVRSLRGLQNSLSDVSKEFGLSATVVAKTSVVLAQSGLTAKQTEQAMRTLAKTTLAATFDSIAASTEGAVAIMAQFGTEANKLEAQLGAINAVSKKFAVESGDIIEAVRRSGGAFKAAGGNLNEFIALFTSVRSTTRESAETIATGFRTIFARLQRPKTIEFFRQLNIELTDGQGNFIGAFEAVRRLSAGLKQAGIQAGSLRFAEVVEQLGGIRQVSRVIPLLGEFTKAEKARQVAIAGGGSLDKDAAKAQETLAQSFARTTENFRALIREISQTATFQAIVKIALDIANAFIEVARAIKPLLPLIAAFGAIKLGGLVSGALRSGIGGSGGTGGLGQGFNKGGKVLGFNRGGTVPGTGNGDTVPAMLEPGEFVIRKSAVQAFGTDRLSKINKYAKGKKVRGTLAGDIAKKDTTKGFKDKIVKDPGEAYLDGRIINEKDRFSSDIKRISYSNNKIAQLLLKIRKPGERRQYLKDLFPIKQGPKKSGRKGTAFEKLLVNDNLGRPIKGLNSPMDFRKGADYGEAKFTKTPIKKEILYSKAIRQSIADQKKSNKVTGYSKREDTPSMANDSINLPNITLHERGNGVQKSIVQNILEKQERKLRKKELKKKGVKRRALGGSISGAGTDTVPALLTPGEFVINKKSAESYGYGNLGKINKYAKGGLVGVQKFQDGGEVRDVIKDLLDAFKAELKGNIETSSSGKKRISKDADLSETGSLAKKARGKLHPDRIAQNADVDKELGDQAFKAADDIKTYSEALKDSTKGAKEIKKAQKGLAEAYKTLTEINEKLASSTGKKSDGEEKKVPTDPKPRPPKPKPKPETYPIATRPDTKPATKPETYPIATRPDTKPATKPETYPIATRPETYALKPRDGGPSDSARPGSSKRPKCINLCARTIKALIRGFRKGVKANVGGGGGGGGGVTKPSRAAAKEKVQEKKDTQAMKKGISSGGLAVTAVALQGLAGNVTEVTKLFGVQSKALDSAIGKLLSLASVLVTINALYQTQLGQKVLGGLGTRISGLVGPALAKKGTGVGTRLNTPVTKLFGGRGGAESALSTSRAVRPGGAVMTGAQRRAAAKATTRAQIGGAKQPTNVLQLIRKQSRDRVGPFQKGKTGAQKTSGILKSVRAQGGAKTGLAGARQALAKGLASGAAKTGLGIAKAMGPQIALLGLEFGLKAAGVIKDVSVKKEEAIKRGDAEAAVDLTNTEQGQGLLTAMTLAAGALALFTAPVGLIAGAAAIFTRVVYDNAESFGSFGGWVVEAVDAGVEYMDSITGWATEARQAAKSASLLNKAQISTAAALANFDRQMKLGNPEKALEGLEVAAKDQRKSFDYENRATDFTGQSEAAGKFVSTALTAGLNLVAGELFGAGAANPVGAGLGAIGLGDTAQEQDSVLNKLSFGFLGTDVAGQEKDAAEKQAKVREEEKKIARKVIDSPALDKTVQSVIDAGGSYDDFAIKLGNENPQLFNLLSKTGELGDAFEIAKKRALDLKFENFKSASEALLGISKAKFDRDSEIRSLTGGKTGRKEFNEFTKEQSGIINFGLNNLQGGGGGGENAFGGDVSTAKGLSALVDSAIKTKAAIDNMRSGASLFSETLDTDLNANGQAAGITLGQAEELQRKQNLAIQQSLGLAKQRLQVIKQEIEARNANIKALNSFVTDFAFSSGKDKREKTRQFGSAQKVAAGLKEGKTVGEIQGVTQADKQASKALFEQFGDIALFGGKTGKEVLGDSRVQEFGGEEQIIAKYGKEQGEQIIHALREGTVSESDKMLKEMSDLNNVIHQAELDNVNLFNEGAKLFADSVILQASVGKQELENKKLNAEQKRIKDTDVPRATAILKEAQLEAKDTLDGQKSGEELLKRAQAGDQKVLGGPQSLFDTMEEVEQFAKEKKDQHTEQEARVKEAQAAKDALTGNSDREGVAEEDKVKGRLTEIEEQRQATQVEVDAKDKKVTEGQDTIKQEEDRQAAEKAAKKAEAAKQKATSPSLALNTSAGPDLNAADLDAITNPGALTDALTSLQNVGGDQPVTLPPIPEALQVAEQAKKIEEEAAAAVPAEEVPAEPRKRREPIMVMGKRTKIAPDGSEYQVDEMRMLDPDTGEDMQEGLISPTAKEGQRKGAYSTLTNKEFSEGKSFYKEEQYGQGMLNATRNRNMGLRQTGGPEASSSRFNIKNAEEEANKLDVFRKRAGYTNSGGYQSNAPITNNQDMVRSTSLRESVPQEETDLKKKQEIADTNREAADRWYAAGELIAQSLSNMPTDIKASVIGNFNLSGSENMTGEALKEAGKQIVALGDEKTKQSHRMKETGQELPPAGTPIPLGGMT